MYNNSTTSRFSSASPEKMQVNYSASPPKMNMMDSPVGGGADTVVFTPSFLFGSARRQMSQTSDYSPSRNEYVNDNARFASPASVQLGTPWKKNVHWSPSLVSSSSSRPALLDGSISSDSVFAHEKPNPTPTQNVPPGAPPLRSLTLDGRRDSPMKTSRESGDCSSVNSEDSSRMWSENTADHLWVTVFGFQRADCDYILKLFSRYGTITAHQLPATGNWIHIRYLSPMQAHQALAKNGKVFDGRLRLAVVPCTEKEACASGMPSMLNVSMTSSVSTTAAPESEVKYIPSLSHNSSALNSSMNASSVLDVSTASSRGGMRSLAAAYKAADRSFRVDQEPLKDQSLMNRLWGYVAGQ